MQSYGRAAEYSVSRRCCHRLNAYCGTNVENAAYPEGLCAEASAIAAMVSSGEQQIEEVAVMTNAGVPCPPCGGCRQKIAEFAQVDTEIRIYSPAALLAVYSMGVVAATRLQRQPS